MVRWQDLWMASVCLALGCQPSAAARRLVSLAPQTCPQSAPPPTPLRLLTRAEYDNTVRDLLGDRSQPARGFPKEPLADGFDNDAFANQVTGDHLVRYLQAAESLALRAVSERLDLVAHCDANDPACAATFIAQFGRRAFRRPLLRGEKSALLAVFAQGQAVAGFAEGVRWTLETILQSPQFLYRDERLPDIAGPLDDYRLATRLAYTFWTSTPDDALLDAAARGDLTKPDLRDGEVRRLLADPRAADGQLRYLALWLGIDGIETLRKDTGAYPSFSPDLANGWRSSIELYLRDVIARGDDLWTLLTLPSLYVDASMPMYASGVELSDAFTRIERQEYAGLLAQPAFLSKLAAPDQSSPVRRGVFVLDKVMCQAPAPPPANANLVPPAPTQATTTRERFSTHAESGCAVCHDCIDGVGFLFENYDALGAWRDKENGKHVDASGAVLTPRDTGLGGTMTGVSMLSQKLATSGQVSDCVAHEWLRYVLGRNLDAGDACSLYDVQRRFASAKGSFTELLVAIAGSDAFLSHALDAPKDAQ